MCSLLPVICFLSLFISYLFASLYILFLRFLSLEIKVDEFRKRQEIRDKKNDHCRQNNRKKEKKTKDKRQEIENKKHIID